MIRAVTFAACLSLAGCGGFDPLSLLTGGGPNVAANGQAGKVAAQTIGASASSAIEQKVARSQVGSLEQSSGETKVRAENVREVVVYETAPLVLVMIVALAGIAGAGLIGFVTPSPGELRRRAATRARRYQEG